jgi:hypothetical protein
MALTIKCYAEPCVAEAEIGFARWHGVCTLTHISARQMASTGDV